MASGAIMQVGITTGRALLEFLDSTGAFKSVDAMSEKVGRQKAFEVFRFYDRLSDAVAKGGEETDE